MSSLGHLYKSIMKVVVATNAFKGSLTANEAAEAISRGIKWVPGTGESKWTYSGGRGTAQFRTNHHTEQVSSLTEALILGSNGWSSVLVAVLPVMVG